MHARTQERTAMRNAVLHFVSNSISLGFVADGSDNRQ